ncbi:MAG: hypothetical protein Rubg2KO_36590 [Rubricoccaceae bacterium]
MNNLRQLELLTLSLSPRDRMRLRHALRHHNGPDPSPPTMRPLDDSQDLHVGPLSQTDRVNGFRSQHLMRFFLSVLLVALASPSFAQATADSTAAEPTPRRAVSLYADVRAYQAGDLLTVILEERTSARRRSESSADESRSVSGGGQSTLGGFFGLDAEVGGERDSDNRTVQSDLLTGMITARVVDVDRAGNLQVEGERRLDVDGAVHTMRVTGLVRPADVTTSNTILSYQIANADVAYRQEGQGNKFMRGRFLTLVGTVAVLIGAAFLAGSAGGGGGDAAAAAPAE